MSRAPFQVLIIPFRLHENREPQYLLFRRRDSGFWQWIAGGGENQETPEQAARRELFEEAGLCIETGLVRLDSVASIPADNFADRFQWGAEVYVIPEFSFGVEIDGREISLSKEHCEYAWSDYEKAQNLLKWDSNKTALWELHNRLAARIGQKD